MVGFAILAFNVCVGCRVASRRCGGLQAALEARRRAQLQQLHHAALVRREARHLPTDIVAANGV